MKKYVVTLDNPYYPEIIYAGTLEKAKEAAKEQYELMNEDDGEYSCNIVIAEILEIIPFNSPH